MLKQFSDDGLFRECIEALGHDAIILPKLESDMIWKSFKKIIPVSGSRIDWTKVNEKKSINSLDKLIPTLEQLLQKSIDKSVYLFWNDADLPVVKANLDSILIHFDDVTCVGFETWMYNPIQQYIIEYYYLGEMSVGLFPLVADNSKQ